MNPNDLFRYAIGVVVLGCGLFVILTGGYSADTQKWGIGIVGFVVGHVFK